MIKVEGPITIKTEAGTVRITIDDRGNVTIETYQIEGKGKYELRGGVHPDGKLPEIK